MRGLGNIHRWKRGGVKKSFRSMLLGMAGVLIGMVVGGIVLSSTASVYVRRQAEGAVQSAAQYYAGQMDDVFRGINDYLGELVFQDKDVPLTRYTSDRLLFIQSVQKINEKLEFYRTRLGGDFQFFIYYPELDYFASSERGDMGIREFARLKEQMARYITQDYETYGMNARKQWWIAQVDGTQYALNYIYFDEWYVCSFIDADRLADTANVIHLGEESYVALVSEDGIAYNRREELEKSGFIEGMGPESMGPESMEPESMGPESGRMESRGAESGLNEDVYGMRYTLIHQALEYADFGICVVVRNNADLRKAVVLQAGMALFILAGIVISAVLLQRIKKRLIEPMRYFGSNLARIQEEEREVYYSHVDIAELAEADALFRKLCGQMKELKIRVYEQELEQKRLEIDYMHLQIQPHFYINCMSLIYNMAVMGEDETIQQLSACVSDYFRYMFRAGGQRGKSTPGTGPVSLSEELRHVRNYLDICRIRYKDRLSYSVCAPEAAPDVDIPPLLLHTFVENSVKYAQSGNGAAHIEVAVRQNEEAGIVVLTVSDNGEGFAPSVLEMLQGGDTIVTDKGTRIGIRNCMRRLYLIYGETAQICFVNGTQKGANVQITIPAADRNMEKEGQ